MKDKNPNLTLNDSLIIEDFKQAGRQIENYEARILRIYILIISGFVIIMGLKPNFKILEIDAIYIPLVLGLFIWITFNFAITDRRLKYFAMSYINNVSKRYKEVKYQQYFCDYMFNKNYDTSRYWSKIQTIIKPFLLIYLFGLFISIMEIIPISSQWLQNKQYYYLLPYLITLSIIHLLIIGKLIVLYKNDFKRINKKFTTLHNNYL